GRLFTTPQARARIEAERFRPAAGALPTDEGTGKTAGGGKPWVFNGVLTRHARKRRLWINGRPYWGNAVLRWDGALVLTLPESGRRVRLWPGQAVDPATGEVFEPWQRTRAAAPTAPGAPVPGTGSPADEQAPKPAGAGKGTTQ
ncbi:MAG: hypothetical protein D6721_06590, partial [Gammaproteobacteria bacterium]